MPEDAIKALGLAIRNARKEQHLTQQALADLTGISKRHIAKIENGIANASFEIITILAQQLHFSIDEILYSTKLSEEDDFLRRIAILTTHCNASQKKDILKILDLINSGFINNK